VSAQLEKEMKFVRNGSEVIRCKTMWSRSNTGRALEIAPLRRALPQRLEFLILPPAPRRKQLTEPTAEKFVNQEDGREYRPAYSPIATRAADPEPVAVAPKVSRSLPPRIESGR